MIYFITTAILMVTVGACFLLGRRGVSSFGWKQWALRALVALPLLASGVAHFTRTAVFTTIVPPFIPFRSQLVLLTGAMELTGAIGLFLPAFTRKASVCLALLMIAIFPANVYVAHQVVGGPPHARCAGAHRHAGDLHRAATDGRVGKTGFAEYLSWLCDWEQGEFFRNLFSPGGCAFRQSAAEWKEHLPGQLLPKLFIPLG